MQYSKNWKLSIIDRYIIKKYVSTFTFTLALLSIIAVVFDLSERIEKLLSHNLSAWVIFRDYYANFIPWINSLLFPLYALITVIFFTSRMASQTEIIPIFSSGVSYPRFLRPFVIAGLLFTVIHLIGNHYIIPRGNKIFKEFENKYIKTSNIKEKDRNVHFFVAPNVKAHIRNFQVHDSVGNEFSLEQFDQNKLVCLLRARVIRWKAAPHLWTISDYEIRRFSDSTESYENHIGQSIDSSINFLVSDFVYKTNQKDMMATPELSSFIQREKEKGSGITRLFEVEKHRRTADPFTTLILTIIGVCIASRKVRGGMGLHLAMAVILGVCYIFLSKLSLTFANNEVMAPWIAVWIPNIIFSLIAYYLYKRVQS
ncbi:MAG TPA: LptF/LptG family permease [Saprospiraceae bacterium]|nr:LptF/LptG family permease [Saprospiraceae bacterium]